MMTCAPRAVVHLATSDAASGVGCRGDTSPRLGCCEVAEGYCGGNLLGAGRLRGKQAVGGWQVARS